MTQYVINIGAIPNDGTGDPLRTAFNETNLNFNQVFAAGPVLSNIQIANNTILTTNTNGNLILAPNGIGVVQSNVSIVPNTSNIRNLGSSTQRWATVYTQYLNVSAGTSVNGNLTVDGNLIVMSNIVGSNTISTTGNITANYFVGNGSQLTGIVTSYGNANVAAYLPTYGGNILANLVTANILGGEGGNISNIKGANVTGEVASANVVTNPSQTAITAVGTLISLTTGALTTTGQITANADAQFNGNVYFAGNVTIPGNINQISGNSGQFFGAPATGFGALYAGLPAGYTLLAQEVAQYSTSFNGYTQLSMQNINGGDQATGDFIVTADNGNDTTNYIDLGMAGSGYNGLLADNSLGTSLYANDGYLYTRGNVTGGNLILGSNQANGVVRIIANGVSNIGDVVATFGANGLTVGDIIATSGSPAPTVSGFSFSGLAANITGNVSGGNIRTGGTVSAAGNVTGGNIVTVGNVSATGNATANYFIGDGSQLTGIVSSYGNANVVANLAALGSNPVSTTGNISGGFIFGNISQANGFPATYGNADVANYLPTFSGNISAGNISATGNVSGAYVKGNGSQLTSLPAPTVTPDITSTGAMSIMLYDGNIKYNNYATVEPASGNITGGNILTGGLISVTGNVTAGNVNSSTLNNSGNISVVAGGNIWTFGTDGSTIFPTLTVTRGDTTGTLTGQTLLFGDITQEAIISTLNGNADIPNSQRLVINPGAGAAGTTGEGGDIYLYAGRGGDAGGSGGDIKIRGGLGPVDGAGGYITMEGGEADVNGIGGYIEIYGGQSGNNAGGYLDLRGGFGQTTGGYVSIQGGQGQTGTGGDVSIIGGVSGNGLPEYGNVNISAGASIWRFDNTGNLALPRGGIVYETNIPYGGLEGKTIALKPYGGTNADQQLLVYPTAGADYNHLHLTTGNLWNTEMFLGNDDFYVKLANTGNIVINTNNNTGNTAQWTFGTQGTILNSGNLTLQTPNGVPGAVTAITGSSGSWESNPTSNLATAGGTGTGLTVNVAENGGYASAITIATPGTGYSNGDSISVVSGSSDASFTISVLANGWTFDTAGSLTLPGGSRLRPLGANLDIFAGGGYVNLITADESSYMGVSGNGGFITTAGGTWQFDTTGNLTAPGNVSAVGNITASSLNGNANISNVTINSYTSVPKLWFKGQLITVQNIVSSTDTVTLWNSNSDPLGWGNVSTGQIVPNKAGWYEVTSRVQFDTNAAANAQNQINHQIAVNGNQQAISQLPNLTGNVPVTMITTAMVELNGTTDYITTTSWSAVAGNAQQINGGNTSMVLVRWVSGS